MLHARIHRTHSLMLTHVHIPVDNCHVSHPARIYQAINNELKLFSPLLASKPQVVVINKVDLKHVEDNVDSLAKTLLSLMSHKRLLRMSAAGRMGVDEVVEKTYKFLRKIKADSKAEEDKLMKDSRAQEMDQNLVMD